MPENRFKAVIWDLDGVIADTAPYHFKAWQEVFSKRGVDYSEEDFKRNFGQTNDTIIGDILGGNVPQNEADNIANEKEVNYRQKAAHNIKPLPGAIELMRVLSEYGVKMAIASSTPMENIQLITGGLGINSCFQAIVSGDEVAEGKPNPQVFLLAAQKLGVESHSCIVIEDAIAGVAAAKRAEMKCLAVTNTHPRASLKEADLVVDKLDSVGLKDLKALFNSWTVS
ncbi:HAD family hydrolase [Chloroflexota bacterium]